MGGERGDFNAPDHVDNTPYNIVCAGGFCDSERQPGGSFTDVFATVFPPT